MEKYQKLEKKWDKKKKIVIILSIILPICTLIGVTMGIVGFFNEKTETISYIVITGILFVGCGGIGIPSMIFICEGLAEDYETYLRVKELNSHKETKE